MYVNKSLRDSVCVHTILEIPFFENTARQTIHLKFILYIFAAGNSLFTELQTHVHGYLANIIITSI